MKESFPKRQAAVMVAMIVVPLFWGIVLSRAQQVVAPPTTEAQAGDTATSPASEPASASQQVVADGSPEKPAHATSARSAAGLAEVIRNAQLRAVHMSCGTWAHEVFTDIEYEEFQQGGQAQAAAEAVRAAPAFTAAVAALRKMPVEQRDAFLATCRRPARKTFAQQKSIDCNGQSDAGQKAEMLVADAIIDLAASLASAPSAR